MKKKLLIYSTLFALSLSACKNDIKPIAPQSGSADFTSYLAIGNSLTAGFADGTLYREGQLNSFPAILAGQFNEVGGGTFKQPLLLDNRGWPNMKMVMGYKEHCITGEIILSPVVLDGSANPDNANNISASGPYDNLGIPGIRVLDYSFPGYGTLNHYAKRMLNDAEITQSMLSIVSQRTPTFFTCWLGNNDVLGYAHQGGIGVAGGILPEDITPTTFFKQIYDALVDSLTKNGAKGVLATIPDVTSTPFFVTIPWNGLILQRQGQADTLNALYAPLGIKFEVGANPFIIEDLEAPSGKRQMKEGELVLLSASDSIRCGGWGAIKPLPDGYTLDKIEVDNIVLATNEFNSIIKDAAARKGLALFDAFEYLKTLKSGFVWNGVKYSPDYVTGGVFSLDGIHLTQRGYAFVANEFIKVINSKYGATIALVDVNDYEGIIFP